MLHTTSINFIFFIIYQACAKNDQTVIPTFWRSYVRKYVRDIFFNKYLDFYGDLGMNTFKKLVSVKIVCCFGFWPQLWTLKILLLPWKTAKRVSLRRKKNAKRSLGRCGQLLCWPFFPKQFKQIKQKFVFLNNIFF